MRSINRKRPNLLLYLCCLLICDSAIIGFVHGSWFFGLTHGPFPFQALISSQHHGQGQGIKHYHQDNDHPAYSTFQEIGVRIVTIDQGCYVFDRTYFGFDFAYFCGYGRTFFVECGYLFLTLTNLIQQTSSFSGLPTSQGHCFVCAFFI